MADRIFDPYEAQEEKEKWQKRMVFAFVVFLRGVFYILKILLKAAIEVLKNVLRTFKILPQ